MTFSTETSLSSLNTASQTLKSCNLIKIRDRNPMTLIWISIPSLPPQIMSIHINVKPSYSICLSKSDLIKVVKGQDTIKLSILTLTSPNNI